MRVSIGSDHAGFEQKQALVDYLVGKGYDVIDRGPDNDDRVDYPDYAAPVAHDVADGVAERGVLVCGTGIGMSMAANKVKGVRAAVCSDPYSVEMTRRHNNANVLCMGGRVIDEQKAVELAKIFLSTEFEGGRHQRRIDEIASIERGEL